MCYKACCKNPVTATTLKDTLHNQDADRRPRYIRRYSIVTAGPTLRRLSTALRTALRALSSALCLLHTVLCLLHTVLYTLSTALRTLSTTLRTLVQHCAHWAQHCAHWAQHCAHWHNTAHTEHSIECVHRCAQTCTQT